MVRRHRHSRDRHQKFFSSSSFDRFADCKLPIESFAVLAGVVLGVTGELVTGSREGHVVVTGNGQHAVMYASFGVRSLVDFLRFQGYVTHPDLGYLATLQAFSVQAFLFATHGHGHSPMEILVHRVLLVDVIVCVFTTAVEMRNRGNILAAMSRCVFTLLQGSWFVQVGFILYPPLGWTRWNSHSHEQMKLAAILFVVHFYGVVLLVATAMAFSSYCSRVLTTVNDRNDREVCNCLLECDDKI